ncbi:membrane protein [Pontibacillus halophilus JSM 076056 = DSM 19796]|uniref:Membrane protein n=1 Tax=Pontibacillus halophilus JSM 076056 = DSM 19796 TaxID=1385510 RepID=A0A0A5IC20_9BACI|nr:membrane protein [Pontibacillus halophilus JSM 076056 = DSM 19796]
MTELATLLLLAFAVSLDSFTVGFTYGMRKIVLSFKAILFIAIISAGTFFVSMLIGKFLSSLLSPHYTEWIGGMILIGIGTWVVFQVFRSNEEDHEHHPYLLNWEIKSLGLVVQILRTPMTADIDRSGKINGIEILLLGLALSIDAFGAGIGAALLGFAPVLTALFVAGMSSLFLYAGLTSGRILSYWRWMQNLSFLPGIILILLGVMKMT